MNAPLDAATIQGFATACLIGALIGLEREKHRMAQDDAGSPGLRTFILIAEIGAIAGWLADALSAPWIIGAALGAVALAVVAGYFVAGRKVPGGLGLTTEFAALVVCLLGAIATLGQPPLAIGLAVLTAAVLAYKQSLHGLVAKLGWDDVYAGVRLLIATFIVLPLLPDRTIDPWAALNPASLWRLVLLISGLSLVGYVATRWLGERKGTALTGVTGGLVSSTAVTLSFARQSRESGDDARAAALASGILLSWAIMFGRVIVIVFIVNRALVPSVLVPFAAMAVAATAWAIWSIRRTPDAAPGAGDVPLENPFSLTAAAKFAAFFALVLVVVKVAQGQFADTGAYVVAALAGVADVDIITLSMAEQAKTRDAGVAIAAIAIAVATNTVVKAGLVAFLGGARTRRRVLLATCVVLAAGLAGAWMRW